MMVLPGFEAWGLGCNKGSMRGSKRVQKGVLFGAVGLQGFGFRAPGFVGFRASGLRQKRP